jgi:hypothetical protein
MTPIFWPEFGVLFVLALLGSAAVMPYSLRLIRQKPLKYPLRTILLLSMLQNAVIFAVVTVLGILAAHAVGFGAPHIEALLSGHMLPAIAGLEWGTILGIAAGAILLVVDLLLMPYWPQALLEATKKTTLTENFLASFYGGINEELLMRLFGLSALVWLASFVCHINSVVLWSANIIMTIIFALGHLPALKGVVGVISPVMLVRSLILNAPVGLVCGWLLWTYGIEASIIAHFSADIVYHVFGTVVLRQRFKTSPR